MPIYNRIADFQDELIATRQDIHENPELGFEENRTSDLVARQLESWGIEVHRGIAKTGLVGVLRGNGDSSRSIGIRADMDALPMSEEGNPTYKSKNNGKMHACGHDGHSTMLLGAAVYLKQNNNFAGTVHFIFQPAEEGGGGGRVMVEEGIFEKFPCEAVYGMHNWPGVELGKFAIRSGPFFAASDFIEATISGKGGHAAKPQETIDPTVIASQIVVALQTIASRRADPVKQVVVSITSFETSSNAFNVIPQEVKIKGTVRTLDPDVRDLAEKEFLRITELTAEALGGSADAKFTRGYPVMSNTSEQTEFAAKVARDVAGECAEAPLVMGGEDFAYMLEERPGAYILLGNGDSSPVHHPEYNFNDDAIPFGCSWLVELVEQKMPV